MTRIAFDMAAFLWTGLLAGKDKENGYEVQHDDKAIYVNSAQHGYDNAMGMMDKVMRQFRLTPHQCILVFEGLHSKKRRQAIDPVYKANRDSRPPQAYEEYQKAIAMVERQWLDVGAISMRQPFVEGDDVLAYVALHSEDDIVIATYDNDLAALVGTNPQGKRVQVWVNDKVNHNKYGDFAFHLITLFKALVGDTSDNIKGCKGFGEKSWEIFRATYGDEGLQTVYDRLKAGALGDLHAQAEEDKLIRLLCEQEAHVIRQFQLAQLHPEWVNTRSTVLEINAGMCKPLGPQTDHRLEPYAGQSWLVTAKNWSERRAFCLAQFGQSPFVALDIETSTPPESDEWLANQVPPNPDGVDVMGSTLTGLSLTFGNNLQYTVYISVDHAETENVSSEEVRKVVAEIHAAGKETVIQNVAFELPVLYNEWGEKQEDNGYHGFLPNVLDTKLEASYVDENRELGLKFRSKHHLGYTQQTFHETTQFTGAVDELRPGGRIVKQISAAQYWHGDKEVTEEEALALDAKGENVEMEPAVQTRQYKMNELPAQHVFGYGCDDTICTAALHNFYRLVMELEHTWETYREVEIDAAYMTAASFLQGVKFSAAKMRELADEDDLTYDTAWATVRAYLLAKGWEGSVCPTFGAASKPADFKEAFRIVTGRVLDTAVRMPEKLAKLMEAEGEDTLAALLLGAYKQPTLGENGKMSPGWAAFNKYVASRFSGDPEFNIGSRKQKQRLLFEVMGLPIRLRNKPTDQMRAAGIKEGGAKTDALAIDWGLTFDAKEEDKPVLHALKLMQMVETRRSLFYSKWPHTQHWSTGRVHSQMNQCQANTRRWSSSGPNVQQLPRAPKVEGYLSRFREVIVPHKPHAVIVSLDFVAQELRLIANESRDENMVACYVGENLKDIHALTGLGIIQHRQADRAWSYEAFRDVLEDQSHPDYKAVKEMRYLGKKCNFTTEFGAQAPKLAQTMLVSETEAQVFIDAKEAAFPGVRAWKERVVEQAKRDGYVRIMDGAVRHLREGLNSPDSYEASKADRQAVNAIIQSSAASQSKQAIGDAWRRQLIFKYDCEYLFLVHDECVWSVAAEDLVPWLLEMHAAMTRPFKGMWIPVKSSIGIGKNFGQLVEIGEEPQMSLVKSALKELQVLA